MRNGPLRPNSATARRGPINGATGRAEGAYRAPVRPGGAPLGTTAAPAPPPLPEAPSLPDLPPLPDAGASLPQVPQLRSAIRRLHPLE